MKASSSPVRDLRQVAQQVHQDLKAAEKGASSKSIQYPELNAKVLEMLGKQKMSNPSAIDVANVLASLLEQDEDFLKRMGLGRFSKLRAGWSDVRPALRLAQKNLAKALNDIFAAVKDTGFGSHSLRDIADQLNQFWR